MTNRKTKILVIAIDPLCIEIIHTALEESAFEALVVSNAKAGLDFLQKNFFPFVLADAQLALEEDIILPKRIKRIRGYEDVPVLLLTDDDAAIEKSVEAGADGYLLKPLHPKVLLSNIRIHLERNNRLKQEINTFTRKELNFDKGKIVFCTGSATGKIWEIPVDTLITHVFTVSNDEELFRVVDKENIWIILVGTDAAWALPLVEKLKKPDKYNAQIILLRNSNSLDHTLVDFFHHGGDDIISINKPMFILARQINSRIEREFHYKSKYVSALSLAAKKLPIQFDHVYANTYNHWKLNVLHEPFEELPGGDFYELIQLENGQRLIILGDVMGKKWGAWFFSVAYLAYIRSTVRSLAQEHVDPGDFIEKLNKLLCKDLRLSEVFTTLTAILFHDDSPFIRISSAAGIPPLVYRASNQAVEEINITGPLLGMSEVSTYKSTQLELESGDILTLYTDGYPEANKYGGEQMVGRRSVTEVIQQQGNNQDLVPYRVEEELVKTYEISSFPDDRTMLTLCFS